MGSKTLYNKYTCNVKGLGLSAKCILISKITKACSTESDVNWHYRMLIVSNTSGSVGHLEKSVWIEVNFIYNPFKN